MTRLVQLCLRQAQDGSLQTYAKPKPPQPVPCPDPDAAPPSSPSTVKDAIPLGQSYIMKLPEELLRMCFQLATQAEIDDERENPCPRCKLYLKTQMPRKLNRVCRRFAPIARPILYSDIKFSERHSWPCQHKNIRHVELFWWTVSARPDMVGLLRRLRIGGDVFARMIEFGPEVLSRFGTLRDLTVDKWGGHRHDMPEEWDLLVGALPWLSGLTALSLRDLDDEHARFSRVVPLLAQLPHLSKLALSGMACSQPPRQELSNWPILDHAETIQQRLDDEIATLPPTGREFTLDIRELHLERCSLMSPTSFKTFLHWPRRLQRFTMDSLVCGGYDLDSLVEMGMISYKWTWTLLHDALLLHAEHLKELRVGQMGPQVGLDAFSLQEFPSLQIFQTYWSHRTLTLSRAAELWLTPALTTLVFDCGWEDSQCGKCHSFSPEDSKWLVELAETVKQRRSAGQLIALERIQLLYEKDTDNYGSDLDEMEPRKPGNAFTRMLEAKEKLDRLGVRLVLPEILYLSPMS